jgi:hypothetical protein
MNCGDADCDRGNKRFCLCRKPTLSREEVLMYVLGQHDLVKHENGNVLFWDGVKWLNIKEAHDLAVKDALDRDIKTPLDISEQRV